MAIKNTVLENTKNSRFARERKEIEKEYNHIDVNTWLAKKTAGLAAAGKIEKLVDFVKKTKPEWVQEGIELCTRALGAYRVGGDFTMLEQFLFEKNRTDERAVGSDYSVHYEKDTTFCTIIGEAKVTAAFPYDVWSEYDQEGKLVPTRGGEDQLPSLTMAKELKGLWFREKKHSPWGQMHEEAFIEGSISIKKVEISLGWNERIGDIFDILLEGGETADFAVSQFEELLELEEYLQENNIEYELLSWYNSRAYSIWKEGRKELVPAPEKSWNKEWYAVYSYLSKENSWYESLVPANSKVSLWD